MPKLIMTVTKKGATKVEAEGFTGQSCLTASAPYESALGGKVSERVEKPEATQISESVEHHA